MPGHRTCCAVHSILSIGLVLIYCCVHVQAGLLWPQPQSQAGVEARNVSSIPSNCTSTRLAMMQTPSSHQLFIDPKGFSFRSKGYTSSILDAAYDRCAAATTSAVSIYGSVCNTMVQLCCRYAELMFSTPDYESQNPNTLSKRHKQHIIKHLDVYVYSFDQSLNLDTDESYTLTVSHTAGLASASPSVCLMSSWLAAFAAYWSTDSVCCLPQTKETVNMPAHVMPSDSSSLL